MQQQNPGKDKVSLHEPIVNKIKMAFPDIHSLWAFAKEINVHLVEINTREKTIYCDCSQEQINLAIQKYKAYLVEGQVSR